MGGNSPCASCKLLRRRCTKDCIFAPYFPSDDPQKFAIVHKVFGASNVSKMLQVSHTLPMPPQLVFFTMEGEMKKKRYIQIYFQLLGFDNFFGSKWFSISSVMLLENGNPTSTSKMIKIVLVGHNSHFLNQFLKLNQTQTQILRCEDVLIASGTSGSPERGCCEQFGV